MKKILWSALGIGILVAPLFSWAQENRQFPSAVPSTQPEITGNIACFDYYKFGSVQADLQPNLAQTVPGGALTFAGKVKNDNDYPLVDGKLSVKIFRREETTFSQGNGNPIVDQFVIGEGIHIKAKGEVPLSYEWKVPTNARGGEYYAAYFFTTSERYNLMGLSFTDDVVGNQAQFKVANDALAINMEFDKNSALLNDKKVSIATFPPHFNGNEEVIFKVSIVNPTDSVKTVPVQWNQYIWDAQWADNRKNTKTELITLQPKETKQIQYTNIITNGAVNYVTATIQDGESKSFISVRYVKDGIEETRINFPSITSFPLKANQEQTLFACAHSTNLPLVSGNTLILTLKDRAQNVISQYRYEGDIAGAMSGFGQKFTPMSDYDYVTLEASLFRGGSEVEKVEMIYDCNLIDPTQCNNTVEKTGFFEKGKNVIIIAIAGLGILVILLAILFRRRQKPLQW